MFEDRYNFSINISGLKEEELRVSYNISLSLKNDK